MLKKLSLVLVFVFSLTAAAMSDASVKVQAKKPAPSKPQGGEVPWPWGTEVPFPWKAIDGYWLADACGEKYMYSFKVVKTSTAEKQIQVKEIDPYSCAVTAAGVGYEYKRIVRAVMVIKGSADTPYRLIVRAYKDKGRRPGTADSTIMALSIENISQYDNDNGDSYTCHTTLKKLAQSSSLICENLW